MLVRLAYWHGRWSRIPLESTMIPAQPLRRSSRLQAHLRGPGSKEGPAPAAYIPGPAKSGKEEALLTSLDQQKRKQRPGKSKSSTEDTTQGTLHGKRQLRGQRAAEAAFPNQPQLAAELANKAIKEPAEPPVARNASAVTALPSRAMEAALWARGFRSVAGVDEAGRGPLAGPVVAGACIIPSDVVIEGVDDSKRLTAAQREIVFQRLMEHPRISCATCIVDAAKIDEVNILQATLLAMEGAVAALPCGKPDFLLIDGNQLPKGFSALTSSLVIKGDSRSHAIAAASILAKVTRDRLMERYDEEYPLYKFAQHKGYGTALHMEALRKHGPCPIHRRSYAPVKQALP